MLLQGRGGALRLFLELRRRRLAILAAGVLHLFTLLLSLAFLASASPVYAIDASWTGGNSNAWGTKQNWSTNSVPGSTDNAKFNTAFTNQPTLGSTAATIGGSLMTTGNCQNVTTCRPAPATLVR